MLRQNVVVGPEATLQDIETQAKYVSSMDRIILKSGFPPRRLIIDKATNARQALPAQTLVTVELDDSICDTDAWMCNACSTARVERTAEQTARVDSAAHHVSASSDEAKGPPPLLPSTITVVSFNVAGCEPSFSAPSDYSSIAAFSSEILKHKPDVICLQEVPSSLTHVLRGYLPLGSTPSHCKFVVLLVREVWAHHAHRLHVSAPAVLCQINLLSKTGVERSIVFGSCHLAPFKELASVRMDQTKSIARAVPEDHPFVFAGDFNMRADEDEKVEGLGFQDVWKEAGMEYSQKFTWDSTDNTKQEGGSYNRYNETCYPFHCRFDRVYLKQGANEMLSVKHFRLIGNKPLTNNKHYLSDHFGMVATFDIRK